MSVQPTFSDLEFAGQRRKTKREEFLEQMDTFIPWDRWVSLIKPYYYPGEKGRKPRGIEIMLRMYLLQVLFNLSDEGCEDAILDSRAMQKFMHLDMMSEQVPDATTLLKFRRIIEKHGLGQAMLNELNVILSDAGVIMHGGSIVDASFVEAPSSTKNATGTRDPQAHQAKKGKNWHFGYKAHIGVDAGSGLVHSVVTTAANVSDVETAHSLVREDDTFCYGDSGYTGIEKRDEVINDEHLSSMDWITARRPSTVKSLGATGDIEHEIETRKASVRSKVEHPFLIVKKRFGHSYTRYRGLEKNHTLLCVSFALSNIAMCISAKRSIIPLACARVL